MVEENKTEKIDGLKNFNKTVKRSFGFLTGIKKFPTNIVNFFKEKNKQKEENALSSIETNKDHLNTTSQSNIQHSKEKDGQGL